MSKIVALLCALLLTLTACGSDESEAKDSIKASLLDNPDVAGTELTDDEAGCVSDGMVDEIGVDKLKEAELIDDENKVVEDPDLQLGETEADAMAEVIVGCVDVEELLAEQLGPMMENMTDEQTSCITEAFDEEVFAEVISASFQGEDASKAIPGDVQQQVAECVGQPAG
ncbi:hypothetical protein G7072_16915 [Nocardioides sp. HDW12B]|uniref:hypothetical protein n=1 Tax=Nocardioides sp. HDW12B TaxID=2714939 RepID=UPI00140BD7C3|nr:hypothetical protein [Nocardioides sp. HDW12B]QIK67804.1 hypothetical protein G7072_16915 [Nocardioides sp. HDW12B]